MKFSSRLLSLSLLLFLVLGTVSIWHADDSLTTQVSTLDGVYVDSVDGDTDVLSGPFSSGVSLIVWAGYRSSRYISLLGVFSLAPLSRAPPRLR